MYFKLHVRYVRDFGQNISNKTLVFVNIWYTTNCMNNTTNFITITHPFNL